MFEFRSPRCDQRIPVAFVQKSISHLLHAQRVPDWSECTEAVTLTLKLSINKRSY